MPCGLREKQKVELDVPCDFREKQGVDVPCDFREKQEVDVPCDFRYRGLMCLVVSGTGG